MRWSVVGVRQDFRFFLFAPAVLTAELFSRGKAFDSFEPKF
jgi:hypothetical protein